MANKVRNVTSENLDELDSFAEKKFQASSYDQLLKLPVPSVSVAGSYFMAVIMLITISYLYFGEINVIVQGRGFTKTIKKTFRIEALQSGIVTNIFAKSGDRLKADEPIIQLDSSEKGKPEINEAHISETLIRMPFTGFIGRMEITNIGQMLAPGTIITTAFPESSPMEVLAEIPNRDIGLITKDTPVNVKVDAFPYIEFGTIPGRVERIIPNVGNKSVFTIVVQLDKQALKKNGKNYHVFPGLSVSVDCITRRIPIYKLIFKNIQEMQEKIEQKPRHKEQNHS